MGAWSVPSAGVDLEPLFLIPPIGVGFVPAVAPATGVDLEGPPGTLVFGVLTIGAGPVRSVSISSSSSSRPPSRRAVWVPSSNPPIDAPASRLAAGDGFVCEGARKSGLPRPGETRALCRVPVRGRPMPTGVPPARLMARVTALMCFLPAR